MEKGGSTALGAELIVSTNSQSKNRLLSMPRSKIKAHTQKDNLVLKKKLTKLDIQIGYAGTGTL